MSAADELAQPARDYARNQLAPVPTPVREETDPHPVTACTDPHLLCPLHDQHYYPHHAIHQEENPMGLWNALTPKTVREAEKDIRAIEEAQRKLLASGNDDQASNLEYDLYERRHNLDNLRARSQD